MFLRNRSPWTAWHRILHWAASYLHATSRLAVFSRSSSTFCFYRSLYPLLIFFISSLFVFFWVLISEAKWTFARFLLKWCVTLWPFNHVFKWAENAKGDCFRLSCLDSWWRYFFYYFCLNLLLLETENYLIVTNMDKDLSTNVLFVIICAHIITNKIFKQPANCCMK